MLRQPLDETIKSQLDERLAALEAHFEADALFYYGAIHPGLEVRFRQVVENLKEDRHASRLVVILNTPGGVAETVDLLVRIIRRNYDEVFFVVPDFAMSAGTIFCLSGDKIFMDYASSLGPIDPQVEVNGKFVPAMGYLNEVKRLIDLAKNNQISQAEFLILKDQDLALLNQYEQARNLTVTLLENWLVTYKFKDWTVHHSNPEKGGKP